MYSIYMKSMAHMVAPIDEIADEEMEVDDDGEGAGDATVVPRVDEPGYDPPPPQPREVRTKSDATRSRSCAATQIDTLPMSELVRGVCAIEPRLAASLMNESKPMFF